MESSGKIKISIVSKQINDGMENVHTNSERQSYLTLTKLKKIFDNIERKQNEDTKENVIHILSSAQKSSDIMADSFAVLDMDEAFEEEIIVSDFVTALIKSINNFNQ